MSSINKVWLIGNLGDKPEVRHLPSGLPVVTLRLATTERWRDKATGEQRETPESHRIVLYREWAELARDHLEKGTQVYVEGRIRTRKWQDASGAQRYMTEIEATQLQILGGSEVRHERVAEVRPPEAAVVAAPEVRKPRNVVSSWDDEPPPF